MESEEKKFGVGEESDEEGSDTSWKNRGELKRENGELVQHR